MAAQTLEERVSELERRMAELLSEKGTKGSAAPWWRDVVGRFADDPEFEEAVRLGQEYRRSLGSDSAESAG